MLVSVGPVGTAQTPRPFPSTRARSERKYGRFEIEYAGVSGEGAASAINDTLLIIAPLNRSSSGRKAWVRRKCRRSRRQDAVLVRHDR
jgi:hypothetical protein